MGRELALDRRKEEGRSENGWLNESAIRALFRLLLLFETQHVEGTAARATLFLIPDTKREPARQDEKQRINVQR